LLRKKYSKRLRAMIIVFSLILLVLSYRTYDVVTKYSPQSTKGSVANTQVENLSETNYMLLDTNGKDLRSYKKKYVVVIDSKPFSLNNFEENIEGLLAFNFIMKSQVDNFAYDEVLKKGGKSYFVVNQEAYEKVNKIQGVKGIYTYVYDEIERNYAWGIGDILSNINEKNNYDGDSLEAKLLNEIKSNNPPQGKFEIEKDGTYKAGVLGVNPENKNIKLTIDLDMNEKIKDILNKEQFSNLSNIGVILMDSETGKIKALAQKDDSIPNILIGAEGLGFEPASTFKLIVEEAALENKAVTLDSTFTCTGQICQKDGKPYSHGTLTVRKALEISCNDTFYHVAQKVGYDKLMEMAEKQGLYSKVLGLTKEVTGQKPLEEASLRNIAIGQSMTVTPIQMAGAINTIVNNGVYVEPSVIEGFVDNKDNVVDTFNYKMTTVISKETANLIKSNMRDVVSKGTGTTAYIKNVEIGGKTGSATGSNGTTHGWFGGYFKKGNKNYTMIVFVPDINGKNKQGEDLVGGNTAAPVFKDIVLELLK